MTQHEERSRTRSLDEVTGGTCLRLAEKGSEERIGGAPLHEARERVGELELDVSYRGERMALLVDEKRGPRSRLVDEGAEPASQLVQQRAVLQDLVGQAHGRGWARPPCYSEGRQARRSGCRQEKHMSIYPLFIGPLGLPELLIILFIVFLIFGANKLPQLGSGLGEGIKNFKKSIKGATEEDKPETPKKESKA